MTSEEFAARVEKVITDARDQGLSNDEMIAELFGILEALKESA